MWTEALAWIWILLAAISWWPVWRQYRRKIFLPPPVVHFSRGVSIIIPFRNEERHLPALLQSIRRACRADWPVEWIFVDDASSDNSPDLIKNWQCRCPHRLLHNNTRGASPKKEALKLGIQKARYDIIITMDADIVLPEKYFEALAAVLENHKEASMIIAPVGLLMPRHHGLAEGFQHVENLFLQAVTRIFALEDKPIMCNGAHLIFRRQDFERVKGYEGLPPAAGGDDMFLLVKFKKFFPGRIRYGLAENFTVRTYPENSWTGLWRQRLRWARKNPLLNDRHIRLAGLWQSLIYTGYFWTLPHPFFWLTGNLILWSASILLIHRQSQLTNDIYRKKYLILWLLLSPWIYTAINLAAWLPVKFLWKERTFDR